MAKINLDKYYTPPDLAQYCVSKTKEVIGEENITEYLEPSVGGGAFLPYLGNNYIAFDISPEMEGIKKADYLRVYIPYVKGRCVIGNPPFGNHAHLAVKFFKKAITQGDYISFILPISQLNNNYLMYEFDLIYSEDLGKKNYSGRLIHCALNIYQRNDNRIFKKPMGRYALKEVILTVVNKNRSGISKVPINYDFSICAFGSSIGKLCEYDGQYCSQLYVFVRVVKYKKKVKKVLLRADWKKLYPSTAAPKLKIWMVYKYLKEEIPELEYKYKQENNSQENLKLF